MVEKANTNLQNGLKWIKATFTLKPILDSVQTNSGVFAFGALFVETGVKN